MIKHSLLVASLFLGNISFAQSYVYDKNLKVAPFVMKEIDFTQTFDIISVDELVSEFQSNSIRANNKFKNKMFILKGEIGSIERINGFNYIGFNVSDNQYLKKYLYVLIYDTNKFSKVHNFDKITNYSVGDRVSILALSDNLTSNKLITGNILHGQYISNPKKNHLVKINNIPDNVSLSYEHDTNRWAQKFSPVVNGKSYCKFFNNSEKTSLKVSFFDANGDKIKEVKLTAKINCHSIFDYNKL
jgi:hypothetical protein